MINIEEILEVKNRNGLNWGQVVIDFFTEDIGISKDLGKRIGALLGSGLNKGSTCGAITGAYIVIGTKYGNNNEKAKEMMKIFNNSFIEDNKYYNCFELLGGNPTIPKDNKIISEKGLKDTVCPKAMLSSINILKKIL